MFQLIGEVTITVIEYDDEGQQDEEQIVVSAGDFQVEESPSQDLGENSLAVDYIYKAFDFKDRFGLRLDITTIDGEVKEFSGVYVDPDFVTECEVDILIDDIEIEDTLIEPDDFF